MKNTKTKNLIKKITDFASVIFILYMIYYVIFAFENINEPAIESPIRTILLVLDLIPCSFAIVWLMLRYQHNMQPFLNYMYTNRRVIMPILGILAIAAQILKFSVMH